MKKKHLFKDWLYASVLSFILYELLWCLLVEHSWDISDWAVYCFDLFYCGVFTASSIGIGELIARFPVFEKFTLRRQIVLYVFTLAVNLTMAFLFENAYALIYSEPSEYDSYAGIYLFLFYCHLAYRNSQYCTLLSAYHRPKRTACEVKETSI